MGKLLVLADEHAQLVIVNADVLVKHSLGHSAPVAEILQMSTNINADTPDAVESVTTTATTTKTPLDELLKNNELTEDQVVWSDYTKAERRQIRAHLNALAAEATENA